MKPHKRVCPGDILAIPLEENRIAVGIVLFISKSNRNALPLGVSPQVFSSIDPIDAKLLGNSFLWKPNYVEPDLATGGRWRIVGSDSDMTRRSQIPFLRIGHELYFKDDLIRMLSYDELADYEPLSISSGVELENGLRLHFHI